ncbi:hypothetical protein Cs7R123_59100 [Catellatospora sp. TT07R-123]|uniref:LamG-like jellyroll fold domain-containing protein n=1 Tax=Catellatospora sp. TT07R-123 TaxID=2733863 RepID=UPI001B1638AF|nr:LamG-like jellyroll fold domain-containing protein [Catellatospora sp. TT07R-123]GHJ48568.1 hypothetical protein Cs7R123_59100 [Catellatospora sp. TT07R-123]
MRRLLAALSALAAAAVLLTAAPTAALAGDPLYPPNPHLWLRADIGAHLSGNVVTQWDDYTPNGHNATMTVAARRPTYVLSALGNNMPAVHFNGSQSLNLLNPASPTQFSIFVVGRNSNTSQSISPIMGPSGLNPNNQLRWEYGSSVLTVGTGNSFPAVSSPVANSSWHVLGLHFNGSTLSFYRNSTFVSSANVSSSGPWVLSSIGAYYSSYFLQGDIAEILIYAYTLNATERTDVQNLLRGKYGLPA